MSIFVLAALVIVAGLAVTAVSSHNKTIGLAAGVSCAAFILFLCISPLKTVVDRLRETVSAAEINTEWLKILLKGLGICLVCEFSSDVCKDMGQQGLSESIELLGKTTVIVLSLPIFESMISAVLKMIEELK